MPASVRIAAAIALLSRRAAASSDSTQCSSCRRRDLDGLSALQTPAARHGNGAPYHGRTSEEVQRASDEVHIVATSGCSSANLWEAELMFFSAQRVGQRGPITNIISGCNQSQKEHIIERHASLGVPKQYKLHFVPELNDKRSSTINKPYGLAAWFEEVGPERDVVACIDPDFIFVRPLTAFVEPENTVKNADEKICTTDTQRKERIRRGVVAANRWTTLQDPTDSKELWFPKHKFEPDDRFKGWTDSEILTWGCSGSRTGPSGCKGVTREEVAAYHATGPPYLAHKDDWTEWLVKDWRDITERMHSGTVFPSYFVDMVTWSLANIHKRRRQIVVRNLQVVQWEYLADWSGIVTSTANPCEDPMDTVLSQPGLPNFVHITGHWPHWNKHWLHENVFERCDATEPEEVHGMDKLLKGDVMPASPKNAFICCVARRFLAAGIKRSCKGRPFAKMVDRMSAGFTL